MKKIASVFVFLSILSIMLVVTSCNLFNQAKAVVESTYDKWYQYSGDKTINIPLGADADEEEGTSAKSLENVELYVYFDSDDGLKIAVQAKTEQNVELLGGLITKTTNIYTGGTRQYTKEEFGAVKWTTVMTTIPFEEADEPEVSANPDECIILAGDNAGELKIQWRKVLRKYMINMLFGED